MLVCSVAMSARVSDTIIVNRDKCKGKSGETKVKRFWPGKAPGCADDNDEDWDIRMEWMPELEKALPES